MHQQMGIIQTCMVCDLIIYFKRLARIIYVSFMTKTLTICGNCLGFIGTRIRNNIRINIDYSSDGDKKNERVEGCQRV